METKGKMLLRVTGVLLMIGGALNAVVGVVGFFSGGVGTILGGSAQPGEMATKGIILIAYSLGCFVYGITSFAAGFYGFKFSEDTYKAKICINLGILLLVLSMIVAIFNVLNSGFNIGVITGEVVPILYLVGAIMNRQSK